MPERRADVCRMPKAKIADLVQAFGQNKLLKQRTISWPSLRTYSSSMIYASCNLGYCVVV